MRVVGVLFGLLMLVCRVPLDDVHRLRVVSVGRRCLYVVMRMARCGWVVLLVLVVGWARGCVWLRVVRRVRGRVSLRLVLLQW